MQRTWVYGAGGQARVVYDIMTSTGAFEVVGFMDDDTTREGEEFLGLRLITNADEFERVSEEHQVRCLFLAVGDNGARQALATCWTGYEFPTVVHPSAMIGRDVKIGVGTVIMPGVVIETLATIGAHCILNNGSVIGHGTTVGDFCHISGNAVLSGEVSVGAGTFIGIGSCVTPQTTIGEKCMVCAGAVIAKDVPDGSKMLGNPAKDISRLSPV